MCATLDRVKLCAHFENNTNLRQIHFLNTPFVPASFGLEVVGCSHQCIFVVILRHLNAFARVVSDFECTKTIKKKDKTFYFYTYIYIGYTRVLFRHKACELWQQINNYKSITWIFSSYEWFSHITSCQNCVWSHYQAL